MEKPNLLKFESFSLDEKKEQEPHEYGCAMLFFDFPMMKELHDAIDEDDVYIDPDDDSYGLEDEPHLSLLYGLHSDDIDDDKVKEICMSHDYDKLNLENLSCFENEKYDVLKFNVKGKSIRTCNKELAKLPYTTDYPDYHPHASVGYLKPGLAKKYIPKLNELIEKKTDGDPIEVTPHSVVYSKPDGKKLKWKIEVKD